MRWSAIGLGIGAAVLLIPALVYVWSQPDVRSRRAVRVYLVPGLHRLADGSHVCGGMAGAARRLVPAAIEE